MVVALVDMRAAADRARLAEFAREIGARVDLVATASGTVRLPEGVLEKGQALVEEYGGRGAAPRRRRAAAQRAPRPSAPPSPPGRPAAGPPVCPTAAGTASPPRHRARLEGALPAMAARLADALGPGRPAASSSSASKS